MLPILAQVGIHPRGRLQALVIVPVQTLVQQIEQVSIRLVPNVKFRLLSIFSAREVLMANPAFFEEFKTFNACGAVISALSGATDFRKEQKQLAPEGVCVSDVIISTPGRLMDHLTNSSSGIKLDSLR